MIMDNNNDVTDNKNTHPVIPAIVLALLLGGILGFASGRFMYAPSHSEEPLYDAPDSPSVPFKSWSNDNWSFKLSGENQSSAQIAVLQNDQLPFVITTNGATSPAFFNIDINSKPHQAYGTVSLTGDPISGLITSVELWSNDKLYSLRRQSAGDEWTVKASDLKPAQLDSSSDKSSQKN